MQIRGLSMKAAVRTPSLSVWGTHAITSITVQITARTHVQQSCSPAERLQLLKSVSEAFFPIISP